MPRPPVNAFAVNVPCPMCGDLIPTPFQVIAVPYGDDYTYHGGLPDGFQITQAWDTTNLKAHVATKHGGNIPLKLTPAASAVVQAWAPVVLVVPRG